MEAEDRKRKDKQRQRELDSDLTQQWAEPVNPPKMQQTTQGHQGRVRDDTALMARGSEREAASRREEVGEQPRSAPPQGGDVLGESGSLTNRSEEKYENIFKYHGFMNKDMGQDELSGQGVV